MQKQFDLKIKILALYQIVGGLVGVTLTLFFSNFQVTSFLALIVIPVMVGLFSFSIYAGSLLFFNIENGLKRSKINLFLQIISFVAFGYAYQYSIGLYFIVGIDFTNSFTFNFNLGIRPLLHLAINSSSPTLSLNINLIAIFLAVYIDKLLLKFKSFEVDKILDDVPSSMLEQIESKQN